MWLVRRLRISTKCRRYLPTILFVLFLASLSTLLLGIPDIPHRAGINDPRSGQRLSSDRIEPPLPVLNQEIDNRPSRDKTSDWDKVGNRDLDNRIPHQFGRGLLDRWKASNGEESESQFRSTGNSNRKFDHLPNNLPNAAKEQYGTGQVTSHKNRQKFPKSSSDFFQPANHIVSNNAQQAPNNAANSGLHNVQNVGYQAPKQGQYQGKLGQNVRIQPENLAKPLPLNSVSQIHQEALKQSQIQRATSKQNPPQILHHQDRPGELGVRSQIDPNKSPSANAARTNIASSEEENRLHQLSNQQPFHPQRINQNGVPNQPQLTSNPSTAMKVINNVPRIQQDHDIKYKTSMLNSMQQQQKLGYQQQQVLNQQHIRMQQQNQQQVQINQQGRPHKQQQSHNQQKQQQQQYQQSQQQQQHQQQQQQQHQQQQQQQQQQQKQLQNQQQQQRQQQQQQLLKQQQQQQQRQNQEPLVGHPSASKGINRELESNNPLPSEPTRRDIVWTQEVEEAIPEAFLWEDVDEWTRKVRAQPVTFMATGTETKCGRPPNQYLEMGNGIKLCARYKDINYIEIEGELFSYYLARLLDIRTVPPLVLSTIQRQGTQWSQQQAKLTEAHWDDGEIVTFTQFLEGFERARIPKTLIKDKNSVPLEISSPELQSLTLSDRVYLAQWSDLIVFDYLIGHIDRVTNHQEGSSHHDVTIQNSIWAHQPIHNLAISKQTSVLWFFDNETGFRMGYRTLYHNRVDGQKYTEFHNSMLHSMCVFRARTVEKITELHKHPNPFESLMSFVRNHEPIAQNLHVDIPGAPNDLPEIFKERLGNVFHWIEQCRQRLGEGTT